MESHILPFRLLSERGQRHAVHSTGEDEVKEVTALVHSLDPEAFINIIKSEGIAGRFYEEPLE